MARVRGRDTGPERTVRSVLHKIGYRFRLHANDLPGHPDIVLRSRRCVIFVHGCFWHRHHCADGQRLPKTRVAYWRTKLELNAKRDRQNRRKLVAIRWRVLVVWECQLRDVTKLRKRLATFLEAPNTPRK